MHIVDTPIESIQYDDTTRQRRELSDIDSLCDSITRIGLLNAIILSDNQLIAGRRRLEAFKKLNRATIPARQLSDLSPSELKLVELDENIRRSDLSWQEQAQAIAEIHILLASKSAAATADYIGLGERQVQRYLSVFEHISDERVAACTSINAAANIVDRRQRIAIETELSKMDEVQACPLAKAVLTPSSGVVFVEQEKPRDVVLNENFLTWAPSYSGEKFNLVHMDLPFGINHDKSRQAASNEDDTQYEDTPELYFELFDCFLDNVDRLCYNSAHIFFWFSMKWYRETIDRFENAGLWVCPTPFIWLKSDNRGIASDVKRRPKHIYESALIASIGDRFQLKVVNDAYSCPTAKEAESHLSAKPLAMLKYFLSSYIDTNTEFLDPTAGSGTALRAAADLGASRILGLEINEQTAQAAKLAFDRNERMRKALA